MPPNSSTVARIEPGTPARRQALIGVRANRLSASSVKTPMLSEQAQDALKESGCAPGRLGQIVDATWAFTQVIGDANLGDEVDRT